MAGAAGFEPANASTKNSCLTTWRRPNKKKVLIKIILKSKLIQSLSF
tara:strand:+ start:2685 stop:2825 length:141 start_codon:yes stop_codon:yes gene_type:complete